MRARAAQEGAGMILAVLLLCGLGQLGTAAPGSQGVKCVVFNDEYMTCMWGDQEDQPAANYSLYYWYQHQPAVTECRRYLRHNGINTGCWFSHSEITLFQTFRVHVNASHGSRIQVIPTYDMKLQDLVKPDPPVNLTLQNMSNHQLQLSWHTPYPRQQCVEHAVRYKSNKDTDWTVHGVSGQLFSFPSVDEEKKYTFQVRSKINQYCGSTQLWSEWSVPMYWGNTMAHNSTGEPMPRYWVRTVLIPVVSGMVLLVLVVMLVRMERVWVVFMPQVPNPSKTFDELFNTHKGNFQEWAGVPKDVVESFTPNYSESICHVSELLPKEGQEPVTDSRAPLGPRSGPLPLKKDIGGL
ncbi:cytokine receptor common subunit gamma isoform X1 [Alligator sinensis]|uniref:Cytokine receptor common subunit gamma isoform X1 n=1 Tax=Alligator sinensis TaxID=38654 RepID=A0A1U7RJF5_ALLSI|nr:cytokine receptor common subunit gamma isoform X1 [Alligator sinensis]